MEPLVAASAGAEYTWDFQMHRILPGRTLLVWISTIVALLAAPAVAQPQRTAPERPSGTGVIEGRVIDGETESPVAGATITLSFIPTGPMPRDGLTIHVVADADGGFLFRDLPAGSHSLVAEARGYPPCCGVALEPDGPLQGVFLGDGERATDLVMRLWRRAVVTGLAADGSRAPAPGVRVTLFDAGRIAGRRRYNPPPGPDGVLMVYAHTCHDGDSLESAAPVTPGNGDVVETLNLAARLVRGVTLSGVVTGPDGPLGNATVHVRPARADPLR